MKRLLKLITLALFISATSCYGQKMVKKVSDVKKLEINKEQFIGKPLKVLLRQIKPKIKFVYGKPENKWANVIGGTYLKFHFVDKAEGLKMLGKDQKPIAITVEFQLDPENTHKPLPKGGLMEWTKKATKEYGDLIIANIRVTGDL